MLKVKVRLPVWQNDLCIALLCERKASVPCDTMCLLPPSSLGAVLRAGQCNKGNGAL